MKEELRTAHLRPSLPKALRISVSGLAFICLLGGPLLYALAQNVGNVDPTQTTDWAPGAIGHAQQMRRFKDADQGSQAAPKIIHKSEIDDDPTGRIGSHTSGAAVAQRVLPKPGKQWTHLLPLISRKTAGPLARQAPAPGSKPAQGRTRFSVWLMALPVRAPTSRRSRLNGRRISC